MKFSLALIAAAVAEKAIDANYKDGNCMRGAAYKNDNRISYQRAAAASGVLAQSYHYGSASDGAWYGSAHRGKCVGNSYFCGSAKSWAMWTGYGSRAAQWLVFDFSKPETIDEVMIDHWGGQSGWLHAPKEVDVQVGPSMNGPWHVCQRFNTKTSCMPTYYPVNPCTGRYARLFMYSKHTNDSPYLVVDEVVFYGKPPTPAPTPYPTPFPTPQMFAVPHCKNVPPYFGPRCAMMCPKHSGKCASTKHCVHPGTSCCSHCALQSDFPIISKVCSTTTCDVVDGHTIVKGSKMENWHCSNAGGSCTCMCHNSYKCTLEHHTAGRVKKMDHCNADAYSCDLTKNFISFQRYSQISLTDYCSNGICNANPKYGGVNSKSKAIAYCKDTCDKRSGCTGFFFQTHGNGHEICGFYSGSVNTGAAQSGNGAICTK